MTIIRSNSISGINSITAQASSLAFYDSTGSSLSLDTGNVSAGVITATTVRVTGDLTVEGTTTTLDTVVTEVDKLEVGANNSTVGVAITQSGTGDILRLYDGASQVVTVADGGNVGIGTDNPTNGTSANARQLVIRNTANPTSRGGLSLIHGTSGTGGFGSIYFGSSNATLRGYIEYAHQTDSMQFGTLAGERLRITSTGNVGIGTDNPSYLLDVKTTDDTTYTAGNFVNNPVARLHNQSFTTDSFASLVFRTGSGDNAIGFVYPGTVNQADFVICNDGGSNGVERFRITSSGVVGIGTDNPESGSKLTVNGGIFVKSFLNSATIHGGGLDYINDGRGTRITSFGASGAKTAISFAQGNGGSGASEIARFDTNGNLVFASSGQGIDFSATSDAGGMTSELLDDYEEGTFTPTLSGFTNAGIFQTAQYIKIGRLVNVFINIYQSSNNMSFANPASISGLPYTTITNFHTAISAEAFNVGGAMQTINAYIQPTTPTIQMRQASDASDKRHLFVHAAYYANA